MLVLLNALQAGNRSGTGRYTSALAEQLPAFAEDLDFAVLWPRHVPRQHPDGRHRQAFILCNAQGPLKRVYMDQAGIRALCDRIGANAIHYPASVGSLLPIRNAVVTIHDLAFLREPGWFRPGRAAYYRFAVGLTVRWAKRIIADSKATAADLEEMLGVEPERIDVIPLGVDELYRPVPAEAGATVRAKYGLPESYFLYVGTLEPRKNVVRLIEAWSRLAETCPQDLVLAGREGWKVQAVREAIAASPHANRIHRPGFIAVDDLPAVLSGAYTFVWPSLWEGFGLPPLEAMACGAPVVTSNVSSLPEVVGNAALTVDPEDVDAIAAAMLELVEDEVLVKALKARGLQRAATFTWRTTAEATVKTYRKVLGL